MLRNCVAAIVLISALINTPATRAQELTVKAGLGYDLVSQEFFFNDSLITDTLDTELFLKTTYLDNFKGQFSLAYSPWADDRLRLRAGYEHGRDDIRARFNSEWRIEMGRTRLDLDAELDWRQSRESDEQPGDSYLYGRARAKLTQPVNNSLSLWARIDADAVDFDSVSSYNYDHFRLGGKAGIYKTLSDFSVLDANLFGMVRQVPDSTELDYVSLGVEGSLFLFYARGQIDGLVRLENRDYKLPGGQSDYFRADLDARHKVTVAERIFLGQELRFESAIFSAEDIINPNYNRIALTAVAGYETLDLSFAAGPRLEWLAERDNEFSAGQDHFELGLKTTLDYVKPGFLFGSVESVVGHRSLGTEDELQSDFTFERLNLIADCTLAAGLSLNVLFSAEWEWHDQADENNQIYLLSTGLSYTF